MPDFDAAILLPPLIPAACSRQEPCTIHSAAPRTPTPRTNSPQKSLYGFQCHFLTDFQFGGILQRILTFPVGIQGSAAAPIMSTGSVTAPITGSPFVSILAWLSRPFRPFSVLPFCRFAVTLVPLRVPLFVLPFQPTPRFENHVFRFGGHDKVSMSPPASIVFTGLAGEAYRKCSRRLSEVSYRSSARVATHLVSHTVADYSCGSVTNCGDYIRSVLKGSICKNGPSPWGI